MLFAWVQGEEEGASWASSGQYVNAYIKNIRCLKQKGETSYSDASFKYNYGENKYDAWSHPTLMNNEKYGNIWVWYTCNNSEAVDVSEIRRDGHFVYVGKNNECQLKFATRDNNYNESDALAQSLMDYLNVPANTYNSQFNKLIVDLSNKSTDKIIDEIFNMSACMTEKLSAEWRFFFFEKILTQDATLTKREAICINRLFTTVKDENQSADLIANIKSKGYENKLIQNITNKSSSAFSYIANGLTWLYYTQNKNTILESGKNVKAENFYVWEPYGNVIEKYEASESNPTFSTFFDWLYDARTYSYTVHLESNGEFRIHAVGTEFSHAGPAKYHYDFYIDPFETVSVYFASKNKYINIEDYTVVMPGVLLAWIIEQQERETNQMLVDIGVTAATFYLSGAAIVKATGTAGKIINSILFVKELTDQILESPEVLNILIKEEGDNGDIFVQTYKDISKVIDCGIIFKEFADKEITSKISLLIKTWDEVDSSVKEELNSTKPSIYNYLQTKIDELDQ